MLTIRAITENKEDIIKRLKIKNFEAEALVENIVAKEKERKSTIVVLESKQAEINELSKKIGQLYKEGKREEAEKIKQDTFDIKEFIKEQTSVLANIENEIKDILVQIPNVPHSSVPSGKSADDNEIVKESSIKVENDEAIPHWDIAKDFNIIDFELGNKITGSGFPVYIGKGAKLQRALISFFLDEATKNGYQEVIPPTLVNEASAFATGQLPDKEGQMYHVKEDNFYLIPTAEVPATNIFRDTILADNDIPVKICAYTSCFRREAGSYGKDVRGLNRLHQFEKVEIVRIEKPENSYVALEDMVKHVESLLIKLELPYRILRLCGGDLSFTSALTYDFEVYSVAQQKWLEVSSVSNFEEFQANRLKLRYKDDSLKKTKIAHTLNGSALALPRIIAALLENNYKKSGIKIPDILVPYTGFDKI